MRSVRVLLSLVVLALPGPCAEACSERLDLPDDPQFLQFRAQLYAAIEHQNLEALSLLVAFPLSVGLADGSRISLANERALQTRVAQTFTPAWRKAVLADRSKPPVQRSKTGLARGLVWLEPRGVGEHCHWRLTAVNHPPARQAHTAGSPLFACQTGAHALSVDQLAAPAADTRLEASPNARLRLWFAPDLPPAAPALELPGHWELEGSGSCSHHFGRFNTDESSYQLDEGACATGDGKGQPEGARASFSIEAGGSETGQWWCF